MQSYHIPFWKSTPFFRILLALMLGIGLEWYCNFSGYFILLCNGSFFVALLLFNWIQLGWRFKWQTLQGIVFQLFMLSAGMLLTWKQDIRLQHNWYGHSLTDSSKLIIRIDEPIVKKEKSFKTTGSVESVIIEGKPFPLEGKLLVYFSKDYKEYSLGYGNRILVNQQLQSIHNSGNPGAFNYERYAAFQQVYHNVYLKPADYRLLKGKRKNPFYNFIYSARSYVVDRLQKYIAGTDKEKGIAEALLIGYKEDLDRDLVQAYSNAGVVHIIAISGLHLGLIYVLLNWILLRLPFIKKKTFTRLMLLITSLWLFALLTGASASVLRSAVMFTFIEIGRNYFKQHSIYNSLAASAFILLCYNPYFLWDVGFQLSYAALLGIVLLQRPIKNLLTFRYSLPEKIWNLLAVTIAAQAGTFPLCIFYFHQFPNMFFLSNLLLVPLSTIVLSAEIVLIVVSGVPIVAVYFGKVLGLLLALMNLLIATINRIPFSLWDEIQADLPGTILLYCLVAGIAAGFFYKKKNGLGIALVSLFLLVGLKTVNFINLQKQKKIVIYNIPKQQAIDFISKNQYYFVGDTILLQNGFLRNFHLKPARIHLQISTCTQFNQLQKLDIGYAFFTKKIILIDTALLFKPMENPVHADLLIISKNPTLQIATILNAVKPSLVVFDASNSLWKIAKWKKECLALALPCFSIPEQGAFIMDIE